MSNLLAIPANARYMFLGLKRIKEVFVSAAPTHSGQRRYPCNLQEKRRYFVRLRDVLADQQRDHSGKKSYTCNTREVTLNTPTFK